MEKISLNLHLFGGKVVHPLPRIKNIPENERLELEHAYLEKERSSI